MQPPRSSAFACDQLVDHLHNMQVLRHHLGCRPFFMAHRTGGPQRTTCFQHRCPGFDRVVPQHPPLSHRHWWTGGTQLKVTSTHRAWTVLIEGLKLQSSVAQKTTILHHRTSLAVRDCCGPCSAWGGVWQREHSRQSRVTYDPRHTDCPVPYGELVAALRANDPEPSEACCRGDAGAWSDRGGGTASGLAVFVPSQRGAGQAAGLAPGGDQHQMGNTAR